MKPPFGLLFMLLMRRRLPDKGCTLCALLLNKTIYHALNHHFKLIPIFGANTYLKHYHEKVNLFVSVCLVHPDY
jgi:hypothetical protein